MVYDMKTSSTFSLFLTAFLFSIVGCATQDEASSATDSATVLSSAVEDSEFSETQPSSEIEDDLYNDYLETGGHVALIVGVGEVMDNGYNEAALSGAKTYTQALFSLHKKSKTTPENGIRMARRLFLFAEVLSINLFLFLQKNAMV